MAAHQAPPSWDSPGKNTGVGCHFLLQCMKVKSESQVAQSCLTLSDSMDCSLPGSSVHGIFQARVLEWGLSLVAASRGYASSQSTGSRAMAQLPCGMWNLPRADIEIVSPALAGRFLTTEPPGKSRNSLVSRLPPQLN